MDSWFYDMYIKSLNSPRFLGKDYILNAVFILFQNLFIKY